MRQVAKVAIDTISASSIATIGSTTASKALRLRFWSTAMPSSPSARWRSENEADVIRPRALLSLMLVCVTTAPAGSLAFAEEVKGRAAVVDGDNIRIDDEVIHLIDVDAPEIGQLCFRKLQSIEEGAWPCGHEAATALANWISDKTIVCDITDKQLGQPRLAHCAVLDQDIAEWLAAYGWAVPDQNCMCEAVRTAAENAETAHLGIWTSSFTMPWEWRKAH